MKKTATILGLAALLAVFSGLSYALPIQTREIKNISFQKGEKELIVLIEYSEDLTYESFTLFSPNRLVIDFPNADRIASQGPFDVNAMGVAAIRTGKPNLTTCRVVFDLGDKIPRYKISDTDSGLRVSFWQEEVPEKIPQAVVTEKPAVTPPPAPKAEKKVQAAPLTLTTGPHKMGVGPYAGMYFMEDEVFQEAYGKMGLGFGAQYFFTLPIQDQHNVDFWIGFFTMSKKGEMTFTKDEIELTFTQAASVSVRYHYNSNRFALFIGPGIDYITYQEALPEELKDFETTGSTLGYHLQAGVMVDILESLAANVFGKYNLAKSTETIINTEEEITVKLGGIQLSIGLIYRFNI